MRFDSSHRQFKNLFDINCKDANKLKRGREWPNLKIKVWVATYAVPMLHYISKDKLRADEPWRTLVEGDEQPYRPCW